MSNKVKNILIAVAMLVFAALAPMLMEDFNLLLMGFIPLNGYAVSVIAVLGAVFYLIEAFRKDQN